MSLETSRLRIASVTGGPLRITSASLVNGAYELATAGGADYELQTERQTTMDNILFIPGIANPVSEINSLLFGQGQPGGSWIPTLSAAMIAANTFGSGVTDILDLSGNNNPFSQATPASRGAWFREPKRGRVNLLTRSNQFDLSPWLVLAAGAGSNPVVTPNAATDPLGGNDAFRIDFNRGADTISDRSELSQTLPAALTGQNVLSVWVKAATSGDVGKDIAIRHVGSGPYASVTLTADWVQVNRVETAAGSANNITFGSRGTFNTSTTVSALVYQMQLESGATPTQIQNVTTAFDVTEQGQRDCYGVRTDGIDDFYTTASTDFTGTSRITVFAALRKRSDAARGIFFEHTALAGNNSGGFNINAPTASLNDYGFFTSSTSGNFVTAVSSINPAVAVVTGQGSILDDSLTIRLNGSQVGSNVLDQGSGTYANDVSYLFRRGGTTLPFNGDLYALIVAGGSYPLSTIQRVERLLSRITPTVNL
jgi:uncharacterized membrane protein